MYWSFYIEIYWYLADNFLEGFSRYFPPANYITRLLCKHTELILSWFFFFTYFLYSLVGKDPVLILGGQLKFHSSRVLHVIKGNTTKLTIFRLLKRIYFLDEIEKKNTIIDIKYYLSNITFEDKNVDGSSAII